MKLLFYFFQINIIKFHTIFINCPKCLKGECYITNTHYNNRGYILMVSKVIEIK